MSYLSWKNMSFGKKISFGFGSVLILLVVLSTLSFIGVGDIVENAEEVINGNKLDGNLAQKEVDHLNWINTVNSLLMDESVTTLKVETDDHQCGFGKWLYGDGRKYAESLVPELTPLLKEIEEPHRKLHESAIEIGKHFQQADLEMAAFLREKKVDHLVWASKVKNAFLDLSLGDIEAEKDPEKCNLGKWMSAPATIALKQSDVKFKALVENLAIPHRKLHESATSIQKLLDEEKQEEAREFYINNTSPLAVECLNKIDHILEWQDIKNQGMKTANAIYINQTVPALQEIQKLLKDIRGKAKNHIISDQIMLDSAKSTRRNVTIVSVTATVVGIFLAFFIAKGIIIILQRISGQMDEGAEQVASASGQVSSSSQQLAEGASQQAASIQETSSSLEEISSMTRQNADNAHQADGIMKETNQVVNQANTAMAELTESMGEISRAGEETSKIIKTIDEIAFQTNLLALNAAVEAARAGEAGTGFAVVADEVRSLAIRAADAANNTSELIEGTVKKVKDGEDLVWKTNDAFSQVSKNAEKVGQLVGEISAASNEQARGIDQVNTAVAEMDKVTQQNAANAEESASAAEEMDAQAEQMKISVEGLINIIGGNGNNRKNGLHKQVKVLDTRKANAVVPKIQEVSPRQIIPLNDADLKEF